MTPLGDRVLIQEDPRETVTSGGILIPDNQTDKPERGKIVATGEEVKSVKEGDIVLFGKYAGSEVIIEGNKLKVMRIADVLVKE